LNKNQPGVRVNLRVLEIQVWIFGHIIYLGALWIAFLCLISILFGYPRWLVNDDLVMSWFASGIYTGQPESDLVFVNRGLGVPIALLYQISSQIPWYALVMLFTNYLSLIFLLYLSRRSWNLIIAWCALATPLALWLSQLPNFTATAAIAVGVGLSLIASYLATKVDLRFALCGFLLVFMGVMWRQDSALIAVIVLLPLVGYAIYLRRLQGVGFIAPVSFGVSFTALVLLTRWVGTSCLGRTATDCVKWNDYFLYNSIRGSFHETSRMSLLETFSENIDWIPESFWLFRNFANADNKIFDLATLQQANMLGFGFLEFNGGSSPAHFISLFPMFSFAVIPLTGFVLIILGNFLRAKNRKAMIITAIASIVFWGLATSVLSFIRLPIPVKVSGIVCLAIALLVIAAWNIPESYLLQEKTSASVYSLQNGTVIIGFILTLTFTLIGQNGWFHQRSIGELERSTMQDFQEKFEASSNNSKIFAPGLVTNSFNSNPYSTGERNERIPLISGWPVFSPLWERRKAYLGMRDDIYANLSHSSNALAFPESENVLMLSNFETANFTATFMNIQLGIQPPVVAMPASPPLGSNLFLWKFVPMPPLEPTLTNIQ